MPTRRPINYKAQSMAFSSIKVHYPCSQSVCCGVRHLCYRANGGACFSLASNQWKRFHVCSLMRQQQPPPATVKENSRMCIFFGALYAYMRSGFLSASLLLKDIPCATDKRYLSELLEGFFRQRAATRNTPHGSASAGVLCRTRTLSKVTAIKTRVV